MNHEWIVRQGRPQVLAFFNGWGMDRNLVDWMRSATPDLESHDLVMLYDYRVLSLPAGLAEELSRYGAVDLVAWSLGVRAALECGIEGIRRAVALNGTPFPVDGTRGIPPDIFKGTLDTWSDANRSRFERRMFAGSAGDQRLDAVRSLRSTPDQAEELRVLGAAATAPGRHGVPAWRFSKAVVGGRDLIFPPEHQQLAWQGTEVVVVGDMPHFPFFHVSGWAEVLA
ncbi:MAG: DUF452 family protein [Chlorobiaceae bacterium]|nr:DUF452 family protein [Chlorobiaceae bacterium]NTW74598.1 DUF452 family protein [Chlorobiaceae bacterium]